jgi:WD40 repeat protein/predicted ATPase/transcriptional regulator with XRE-family HTH domain
LLFEDRVDSKRRYKPSTDAIGRRLLTLRTLSGLTQAGLAEHVGVSKRSILKWEGGDAYPNETHLRHLIEAFVARRAFTAGQELVEAEALWEWIREQAGTNLSPFATIWFEQLLRQQGMGDRAWGMEVESQPPTPNPQPPSPILDWGDSIDVPVLYGRDAELATLRQWVLTDGCRVVALLGLGGLGKTSLALTFARQVLPQFEVVLFRSLRNAPPPAEVLDQLIGAVSTQPAAPPEDTYDKIGLLIQLLRARRCLLVLDNVETIMQSEAQASESHGNYADYGALIQRIGESAHQSCLILTSREKPAELTPLEGRTAPVRSLALAGLDDRACRSILAEKDVFGSAPEYAEMARLYGGNPLALKLASEPIRAIFGGDVRAFLNSSDTFFDGLGRLLDQQFARSTPLEQIILYWLAIKRELVPLSTVAANLVAAVPQREVHAALESLRRRMLIERGPTQPTFTLQPVILEYVTGQLVEAIHQEIIDGQPRLLYRHAIVQAGALDYVRRSQERLIATPLLERLVGAYGSADAAERRLLALLTPWRNQPPAKMGYGPGNIVNLLRLLRGHLRGLDLARQALRDVYLQAIEMQDAILAGATIQESLFTETFDVIQAVAASSTGEYWAAATRRGELVVWKAGDLSKHHMWRAHTDMVWNLTFSPDGRMLASCSWDGTVKLSDVVSGTVIWSGHHTSHVNSVAFAPDSNVLASGGNDAAVRLWDVASGVQLQALPHPGPVCGSGVTWSSDGRLLASGDLEGYIRVWEIQKIGPATCIQTIAAHTSIVDGLAFSPDGSTLASASWDGTVKLWDTSTALSAGVAGVHLLQMLTGHTGRTGRVAWSPDGHTVAVSGYDPTIWLWDVERSTYRATLQGHTDGVCGLAFTPDSRTLLSCGNGMLRVWDATSGQAMHVVQGYQDFLYVVDWSPDGTQLVSGSLDALVTVWDVVGGVSPRVLRGHSGGVCGVGWSPDGRWLASSEWDNAVRLWNPASGDMLQMLRHPHDTGNIFYGLVWSPDGRRLAIGTSRRGVLVWDVVAQHRAWASEHCPTFIRQVAWNPKGTLLAGGGDDGIIYIWDANDGTLIQRLAGHHSMITSLAWSPAGTQLASGGRGREDGELFMWDVRSWERVDTLTGQSGVVYALTWGASDGVLVSGGGNGNLCWWDVRRRTSIRVQEAHQGTVQSIRRSPAGTQLASCGDDGAIMLWDLHTGEHLRTLRRDRPYERMNIDGLTGITEAQRASLVALGAVEAAGEMQQAIVGAQPVAAASRPAEPEQPPASSRKQVLGLPFQPTSFVGREAEVVELVRILSDPACRLLTLLGPGGIGKTRLALAVATEQTAAFADGIAFVGLASVGTPSQIVSAIGDTLGLAFGGQRDPTAQLLGHLRDRHMLLVLDNFEHLLAGADLVYDILAQAPRVTLLITSRERLSLQAEWLFDMQGLTYPTEDSLAPPQSLANPTDYNAVQLFIQRAAQVQPGFAPSESALRAIARICQYVAGMPLAIELAAAGARSLPTDEIERQIRANLDTLATTLRDVPARHRSMRAVFEHSWRLLGESERVLFSRLAIFRGGFTPEAATSVAELRIDTHSKPLLNSQFSILNVLTALVDKSLLRQEQAEPRFVFLEPIREYALEQLVARDEAPALQRAHAAYYLALAEEAAAKWDTPLINEAIAQQRREHDNMRAALQWACDTGTNILGLQLAVALWGFWRSYGYIVEGRTWLEQLLKLDTHPSDPVAVTARQRGLYAAAWLASDQQDYTTATRLFEESNSLRRALGETEGETDLLLNAARQARAVGQYQRATALLENVLSRRRAQGDHMSMASAALALPLPLHELGQVLRELALVLREQGDFERAAALLEEALELHRAAGDRVSVALVQLGLGDVARDQGNSAKVREYCEPSLAIFRESEMLWAIGFSLNNLALAEYLDGQLERAFTLARESLALFRTLQADGSIAEVLVTVGQIARAQGDQAAANTALTEALRLARAVGPHLTVAAALEGLAGLATQPSQTLRAVQLLAAASALRAQMGTPVRLADRSAVEHALAAARSSLGDDGLAAAWATAEQQPLEQILSSS